MKNTAFETLAVIETIDGHVGVDIEMSRSSSPRSRPGTPYMPVKPDNTPAVLTYTNINVSTKTNPPKVLLNNVHGSITGGFWAIMGPSGSGKTTLLSTLSLRLNSFAMNVTGDFRLNGREYDAAVLKSMSAYVMQDDLLHAELTVAETLHWAAELRMPQTCTDEEREARVQEVTKLMGIGHCANTIVGNTRRKGISGGERKRLCVAIELLNHPKLIFLDEPTTGLDSTTAFAVCRALKNLADSGECTVVCTIHQPAPNTFALFDNLILMKDGEALYQGGVGGIHTFLAEIGKPYQRDVNLAEHLIQAISPAGAEKQRLHESSMNVVPVDLSLGQEKSDFTQFTQVTNLARKTWILIKRNFKQQVRNYDLIFWSLASTLVIAFFISGGIWQDLGNNQQSATKIPGALFFTFVNQGIVASLLSVNSFPSERAIMLRERQAGAYTTLAYFLAKSTTDTIFNLPVPIMFSCIVYPMFGLQPVPSKFFLYMYFITMCNLSATALATAVTCLCVTVDMSVILISLLFEISRLYGGFFTSPAQLQDYSEWRFLDAISFMKYTYVGSALNELTGKVFICDDGRVPCPITSGEQIIADKGYDEYTIAYCAGIIALYVVVCRIIAYVALKFVRY